MRFITTFTGVSVQGFTTGVLRIKYLIFPYLKPWIGRLCLSLITNVSSAGGWPVVMHFIFAPIIITLFEFQALINKNAVSMDKMLFTIS